MLELERFDTEDFNDILEAAKKKIGHINPEWSNTQVYDPGMTIIDLFAWLKVVQHEYMSVIRREGQYQLLNLLNIEHDCGRPAEAYLCVRSERDLSIPMDSKWAYESIVFENSDIVDITSASILGVGFLLDGSHDYVDYKEFNGKRLFTLFGERVGCKSKLGEFEIYLDAPLLIGSTVSMYFDVLDLGRNPINITDEFIEIATIKWQIATETGFRDVEIIEDQTHNFLYSGVVRLRITDNMALREHGYVLRAVLVYESYDVFPVITSVYLNSFKVFQKNTLCKTFDFIKSNILDRSISICSAVALYGINHVYVKYGDGFKRVYDFEQKRDATNETVTISNISLDISGFFDDDIVLKVVSYTRGVNACLGGSTSISDQEIAIPYKGIQDFSIMVDEDEDIFYNWEKTEFFSKHDGYSRVYRLDLEDGKLVFGNHENGMIPPMGEDNIILSSLSISEGKGGNIKAGCISRYLCKNTFGLELHQISDAIYGEDPKGFNHLQQKAAEIFKDVKNAVTMEDYETIVKNSPGLIIDTVKVIPNVDADFKEADNNVTVIVKGIGRCEKSCMEGYRLNIINQLDKYRLINTKVNVIATQAIDIIIGGNLLINPYYRGGRQEVEEHVRKFIDALNKKIGQTLYHGDLFGLIDRLECVYRLENLTIEPSGKFIEKTLTDDIIISPNGVYNISAFDFDYIKSTNI